MASQKAAAKAGATELKKGMGKFKKERFPAAAEKFRKGEGLMRSKSKDFEDWGKAKDCFDEAKHVAAFLAEEEELEAQEELAARKAEKKAASGGKGGKGKGKKKGGKKRFEETHHQDNL